MNNKLSLELAREYYKLAPTASASFYALIVVTLYFFWGKLPTTILLGWVGVNFIAATSFIVAAWQFKRYGTPSNANDWLRIYAYLVLFQDAPWGLIGPMSFMTDNDIYRMLTLFMLGGMAAGAIPTRALVFKTYLITLFSLLTPIIITLALQGTTVADGMLALVLIYLVFMIFVAKSYSASINRNIQLWLDNEKLVEQLRNSHAEVEQSNRILTSEISQRKKIEVELIKAKERAEQANEAKNQFLANVSHELRTPLNGIMGFTNLLQDEKLEQRHKHYVSQIGRAAQALLRNVNDILDITAIEAGQVSIFEEPFSLRTEMDDVVTLLRPMAEGKKLTLQMHVDEDVEDTLSGDAYRLRQIVGNLLSNAVKYTEAGCVDLRISRQGVREGKVVLRFDVEDTGIGIATDALQMVFENFIRLENFETRRTEGAGLGLAIVKNLVQKMNGKITIQSTPGDGSCFSFELAFKQSEGMLINTRQKQMPGLRPDQWQALNVLVVDDNEINRMVLTAFLSKAGIPFSEAINGHEAIERIRLGDFDVVLLDIQMPDISGIEVAKRLHAELAPTPVLIAVTAHAFPAQRQAILDAGFSDMLIKPIVIADLMKALTQAYRTRHEEHEVCQNHLQGIQ